MSQNPSIAGTGGTTQSAQPPGPGSLFGVPKYSTQRRFVPDAQNSDLGFPMVASSQKNVPTTRLDQLDIVQGWKIRVDYDLTWTQGSGNVLTKSPFYPASIIQSINFKLQAAYNSFNLTGPLASLVQAYRPMWGSRQVGTVTPDVFADPANATAPNLTGTPTTGTMMIDVPYAIKFDEYYELSAEGDPMGPAIYDAIVSPAYMAAQARTITPTITLAPGIVVNDLLGGPVSSNGAGSAPTFANTSGTVNISRDAFWTAPAPQSNPPQYAWLYTRDFYTTPTNGQASTNVLLLNTGVSLGQVLSIAGFVWDPAANSGAGSIVPLSDIATFEIVIGGSLQQWVSTPAEIKDRMRSLTANILTDFPDGVFVWDFAMSEDGSCLSNAGAINTYLLNGVALQINFASGSAPSSTATVYLAVEALKLATS